MEFSGFDLNNRNVNGVWHSQNVNLLLVLSKYLEIRKNLNTT